MLIQIEEQDHVFVDTTGLKNCCLLICCLNKILICSLDSSSASVAWRTKDDASGKIVIRHCEAAGPSSVVKPRCGPSRSVNRCWGILSRYSSNKRDGINLDGSKTSYDAKEIPMWYTYTWVGLGRFIQIPHHAVYLIYCDDESRCDLALFLYKYLKPIVPVNLLIVPVLPAHVKGKGLGWISPHFAILWRSFDNRFCGTSSLVSSIFQGDWCWQRLVVETVRRRA